jgi:DNA-directed RNA polymerase sigma subunit (sigma70/sigma32)
MNCIELRETTSEKNLRIDRMLREMVVQEGLDCLEEGRPPRSFTLEEIGDFVGVNREMIRRAEVRALREIRDLIK